MARRAGLDHEQVLHAAAALADAEGAEALTLGALAARLGVRTPSLYNYVAGLPGLYRELALMGTRMLGECMARAAVGRSRGAGVAALAHAMRAFIKEHPGLYSFTVRSSGLAQVKDEALAAAQEQVVQTVLAVLASYGLQAEEDALHATRALRSIVHGFTTIELAGGFGLPLDLDESFERLLSMFVSELEG